MSRIAKIILIIIVVDIVIIAGYFVYRAVSSRDSSSDAYDWVTIDAYYSPQDYIEEFIKNDAEARGLLPVYIKNYGRDEKMLRRFRGRKFAGPSETQIKFEYRYLEDWQLVDLKYTAENEREVQRTNLYVQENGVWKVGDTGSLMR